MRVLVACEFSGIVRDAFLRHGHNALSCDLLPTESPGPHYQGDVMDIINDGWDMMIAHPPCTYLSYAAMRVWNVPGRCKKRLESLEFFRQLWEAPINKICIENPKGCASPVIAKYSQEIQPYFFGEKHLKTTWLWLKNLPLLEYVLEDNLFESKTAQDKPQPIYISQGEKTKGKKEYYSTMGHFTDYAVKDRPKERARFWPAVAESMACQWGNLTV